MDKADIGIFRHIFLLAGLWNCVLGLAGLVFDDFVIGLFFDTTAVNGDLLTLLLFRIVALWIIVYGAGYCMVSRSPGSNRGIVWLGMASKLLLFIIFTWYFITGPATIFAFLAVLGDLLWSAVFFIYLVKSRVATTPLP